LARFRDIFSAFTAGEITPKAWGRADIPQYKQACEELTNFLVYPQGGVGKRPGTQFISDESTFNEDVENNHIRLVPFYISNNENYIIIFDLIHPTLGHPVLGPGEDYGVTIYDIFNQSIEYPVPYTSSSQPFNRFTGFTSAGQLDELQYRQYGNSIFFAQEDVPPFAIRRDFDAGTFSLYPFWAYSEIGQNYAEFPTDAEIALAWPYTSRNTTATTMTINTATVGTGRTLTASAATFDPDHVGSLIRVTGSTPTQTGVAVITAYTSSTVVTVRVLVAFEGTSAYTNWAFSSWSEVFGWPATITFFENRLIYGGSAAQPNAIWASRSGNLADMRQEHYVQDSPNTLTNDDPFEFIPSVGDFDRVRWVSAAKTLSIGTVGRELIAYGPDQQQAFGALNFTIQAQSAAGSAYLMPLRREDSLLFVQKGGKNLKEFIYNFNEDSFKAVDVMLFAEHFTKKRQDEEEHYSAGVGISGIAHQDIDNQTTWFKDERGGLFAATRNRTLEINAFHYHSIGGKYRDISNTEFNHARVLSICTASSPGTFHDDVYLAVERYINGAKVIYLERINREFEAYSLGVPQTAFSRGDELPIYVDCAMHSYIASPTVTHPGFTHLAGETVEVVADGKWVGEHVVSGAGVITLEEEASSVVAGYNYTARLKTTNINLGSVIGTSQGVTKSIDTVTLRFSRTVGAKFGNSLNNLDEIEFRDPNQNQDDPIPLFTGDKEVAMPEGWENKFHVYVVQDIPLPCHVEAIIVRGLTND
jgi:hypothetical protein